MRRLLPHFVWLCGLLVSIAGFFIFFAIGPYEPAKAAFDERLILISNTCDVVGPFLFISGIIRIIFRRKSCPPSRQIDT
jgi:hypothetical protein